MKITKSAKIASLFILCATVVLSGCNDKSSLLVKTWKVDEMRYNPEIPAGLRQTIAEQTEQIKNNYTITYSSDGTYKGGMPGMETAGKWKLNVNSTKITTTGEEGKTIDYDILQLDKEHFTFKAIEKNEKGSQEVIFVMVPKSE